MAVEQPAEQRGWAAFAHACIALDVPFALVALRLWNFGVGYALALMTLAPIVTYMVYARSRRHPDREWVSFHALQAALLQSLTVVLVFALPPSWWLTYRIVGAIIAAVVVYGLAGAVVAYTGRDFRYAGLSYLAAAITRRGRPKS